MEAEQEHEPEKPKIRIELIDGVIQAKSEYNPQDPSWYRWSGGKWDAKNKVWKYALSLDSCKMLRRSFGQRLVIGRKLNDWARDAKQLEDEMRALTQADDAELEAVNQKSPVLAEAMGRRRYQRVGAKFIAKGREVLIADEPGLGKTLEAIGGLMEAGCWVGPVLVVAPLTSLRTVWERELAKWAPDAVVTVAVPPWAHGASARMTRIDKWLDTYAETDGMRPHFLIVNPEMVRDAEKKFGLLLEVEWNAIIVDESHKYLGGIRSAQNRTKTGAAMLKLKLRDGGVRIALSGTPLRGRPSNLWGTLHWLRPHEYTSFYGWARQYFHVSSNRYSAFVLGDIRRDREDDLYRSLDKIMLRRTKGEVVADLPPKQHIEVFCDMTPVQEKMYKQMSEQAMAELGDEELSAVGVLAIMTRLKQMANCSWNMRGSKPAAIMWPEHSCKAAVIEQMLIERGIAGDDRQGEDKIVIASQFTEVINSLGDYLDSINVEHMKITGQVRESERVVVTDTFQAAGGPRVLLMNTKAGGVSITLDAFCDELIIIDETWVPDDQLQLEDRIHRVSRIHQVMIYQLITNQSIDEYIKRVTEGKRSITDMLLDGRRGVDLARTMAVA
jgi:SNF2 family DNA or RNA helicase